MWAVGGGFWLKIEPMSFSPFASFFVWQTLAATAAIQEAAEMKGKHLCGVSSAATSRWMSEMICRISFWMTGCQFSDVGGSFSAF